MPEIKTITLKDGRRRYQFVVDVGRDPATGHRRQKTHTFDTKREARDELARITHQRRIGDYVLPAALTVGQAIDLLLPALCVDVEPATAANYAHALRPVRAFLGTRPLQSLHEQDIDDLVQHMLTAGRVRGGKPGTGLGVAPSS